MSRWGVHVGFAGIVTVLLLGALGVRRLHRWVLTAGSGGWAVVPDLYHLAPSTRGWYKPLLHDSALADLFWLHRVIDRANPGDQVAYSLVGWAACLVVFLLVEYWRWPNRAGQ